MLQFETGILAAWNSPGVISQTSINEVIKYSAVTRIQILASSEPYAHSHAPGQPTNASGDVDLGVQGWFIRVKALIPTVAVSVILAGFMSGDSSRPGHRELHEFRLASGQRRCERLSLRHELHLQMKWWTTIVRRAQLWARLFPFHIRLRAKFGLTGEIWHFNAAISTRQCRRESVGG